MGREIRRVPLDFDWPLNKVWDGFVNQHYRECAACRGTGATPGRKRFEELVRLLLLSGDDARTGRCHPYFDQMPGLYRTAGVVPSRDLSELTIGLAGREPSFLGHDSVDNWRATAKIVRAAGLKEKWGICAVCRGHGIDPSVYRKYKRWRPTPPPAGPGWQAWETVSEGSPVTPVFADEDLLVQHLIVGCGYGEDAARAFVKAGWVPSLMVIGGEIKSDIEAASSLNCTSTT